ncbi:MAG: hypothetical protein B7Y41_12455 [Hydrogenophilales bacterium 28-61-23]|nr:MAG: hypothetical protein B7Y41_12455 [Hydrogenophilales bacterium 28-61-23]
MLIALVAATLVALLVGQALPRAVTAAPAMWAHIALAVGVMTLITAAMQHFVPVLARTRGAGRWMGRLPMLMLVAGGLAVATFSGALDYGWISGAALLGLLAVTLMIAWMLGRARGALGRPHPGLYWYVAAMACLAAGLLAAVAIPLLPQWHNELRAFHLHINLYGFVAITAIGTLQVLMPTAAGLQDPSAAPRLRTDLKWALIGALLIALGQTFLPALTWLGAGFWVWVLGRMLLSWWRLLRSRLFAVHGSVPVLLAATLGFAATLAGLLIEPALARNVDPNSGLDGIGVLTLFLPGFLMPLVTGAAGQLAPVWLAPTRPVAHHRAGQARLGRWGGARALMFLSAALLPLFGYRCSGMPALIALFWFGAVFAVWLYRNDD